MSVSKKINLKDNEKIVDIIRPYILAHVGQYFLGAVFLLGTSFFMFRLFSYGWWGNIIYGLGMVVGFYIIFRTWFMGRKNILVLTSVRVVDVHRVGWFDEIISSVSYLDVKDVAIRKKGIWQSLFNFGGLSIASKGESFVVEILNINNPAEVQTLLSDLGQQYKQDIKVVNSQVIFNNFVKIIPNLPDGDLQEVRALIDEQLGPNVV